MKTLRRKWLLVAGDVLMLVLSFFATMKAAFPQESLQSGIVQQHIVPFTIMYGLWITTLYIFNLYEISSVKPTIPFLRVIGVALLVCLAIGIAFFYVTPLFGIEPKTNLIINAVIFGGLFLLWRRMFYHMFASYFRIKTVLITDGTKNRYREEFKKYIYENPQSGYDIVKVCSSYEEFLDNKEEGVDLVVVARKLPEDQKTLKRLYQSSYVITEFSVAYENLLAKVPVEYIGEEWLLRSLGEDNKKSFESVQRLLSIGVGIMLGIFSIPFVIAGAVAIKIKDKGPIFYTQKRVGKNGKLFTIYKLRTMVTNADAKGGIWQSEGIDPRITKIGYILRMLHIDELPQVVNILKGDINLIGPRPEKVELAEVFGEEIPYYHIRHSITPGFTGWAQIKYHYARNIVQTRDRLEYDLYYIKNRNLAMDMGILIRTIQIVFSHAGK